MPPEPRGLINVTGDALAATGATLDAPASLATTASLVVTGDAPASLATTGVILYKPAPLLSLSHA